MCRNGPGKFDIGDDTFGHWFGKDKIQLCEIKFFMS